MSLIQSIARSFLIPPDLNNQATRLTEHKTRIYCLSAFMGTVAGAALYAATRQAMPRSYAALTSAAAGLGVSLFSYTPIKMQVKEVIDDRAVSSVYNSLKIPADVMSHLRKNPAAFLKLCGHLKDVCKEHRDNLWELFCKHDNFPMEEGSLFAKLVDQLIAPSEPLGTAYQHCLKAVQARNSKVFHYMVAKPNRFTHFLHFVCEDNTSQADLDWIWKESEKINWDKQKELMWDLALKMNNALALATVNTDLTDKICSDPSLKYRSFLKALMKGRSDMAESLTVKGGLKVEHFLDGTSVPEDFTINAAEFDKICSQPLDTSLISKEKVWGLICKLDYLSGAVYPVYTRLTPEMEDRFNHFLYAVRTGRREVVKGLLGSAISITAFTSDHHLACWASVRDDAMARLIRQKYTEPSSITLRRELNRISAPLLLEVVDPTKKDYSDQFSQLDHLKFILASGMTSGMQKAEKVAGLELEVCYFLRACIAAEAFLNAKGPLPGGRDQGFNAMTVLSHTIEAPVLWLHETVLWPMVCTHDYCDGDLFSKLVQRSREDATVGTGFSEKDIENKFFAAVCSKSPKVVEKLLRTGAVKKADLSDVQQFKCLISSVCTETTFLLKDYGFNLDAIGPEGLDASAYIEQHFNTKYPDHLIDLRSTREDKKDILKRREKSAAFESLVSKTAVATATQESFDQICKAYNGHSLYPVASRLWQLVCKFDYCSEEENSLFLNLVKSLVALNEEALVCAVRFSSLKVLGYLFAKKLVAVEILEKESFKQVCAEVKNPALTEAIEAYVQASKEK
ncbi:MAG: hypothetical protein ABSA17_02845 [Rhabdochlamydiaceae bacterium]